MSELESRRRAIADALREVMTEPLSDASLPLTLVHEPVDDYEEADAERSDDPDVVEEIDDESTTPAIPPLERLGAMSPVAARALFGHH
jgi:hypothetical protein